ncbi:MAG: hypothetical protein IKL92_03265, partial [Oscillospiraceae bacterium]|nr:hypothetical protein [Oscillospiraceae bacterium]
MKRIICFVLCLVMIMGTVALVSCAEKKKENNNGTVTPVDPDDNYIEKFEGLDFEETEITFALSSATSPEANGYRSCLVEEKTGDSVSDAIFDRNQLVEAALNVDIVVAITSNHVEFTKTVETTLQAGDPEYDWLWGQQANDIDLCLQGYIYDLNRLGEKSYIDPDAEWWAADYMDHYQYKDEMYWLSGPLSLIYAGGASCTFVNARLYDSNFKATHGDIYDFVREGKWTVDEFAAMSATVYQDTNSNDTLDEADVYGYANHSWGAMILLGGIGLQCSSRNADGSLNFLINTSNDKYIYAMQKTFNLFEQCVGINNTINKMATHFADGNQMFSLQEISALQNFREMQDDFYLIPAPKLDLDQPEYISVMSDGNQIMGLSYTCEHIEAATATLELMAYYQSKMVSELYFDEVLKYKYSRDEDTAEMVQLVHDSVYTDFAF